MLIKDLNYLALNHSQTGHVLSLKEALTGLLALTDVGRVMLLMLLSGYLGSKVRNR